MYIYLFNGNPGKRQVGIINRVKLLGNEESYCLEQSAHSLKPAVAILRPTHGVVVAAVYSE